MRFQVLKSHKFQAFLFSLTASRSLVCFFKTLVTTVKDNFCKTNCRNAEKSNTTGVRQEYKSGYPCPGSQAPSQQGKRDKCPITCDTTSRVSQVPVKYHFAHVLFWPGYNYAKIVKIAVSSKAFSQLRIYENAFVSLGESLTRLLVSWGDKHPFHFSLLLSASASQFSPSLASLLSVLDTLPR